MRDIPPVNGPIARPIHAPSSYAFPSDPARLLPWSFATDRLAAARIYWLATTRPDGRPHVTPLWGVWVDAALYIDGHPATIWARNIAARPDVAVHLESGDEAVIIEGRVEDVPSITDPDLAARIVADWLAKYGRLAPEPATRGIFRLRPRSARAWSTASLNDGTRWTFAE